MSETSAGTTTAGATGRGGWIVALLLLAATVAVAVWHVQLLQFFCDDSYISYRYSENFAAGKGLVYNDGERVEGYTNFLWVVLVGGGIKAGFGAEATSLVLGLLFLGVTLLATALLVKRVTKSWRFGLVACVLLVCQGPMILWSSSGLEASCYAAMTLLAVLAYERWFERPAGLALAGALFGLSTMVRPDGVVFGGAAGLHLVLCALFAKPRALGRAVVRGGALALGFAAAFGPFVLWRHAYYDDWLPNTFYIKAGGALNLRLGAAYLLTWLREYPIAGALTLAGLVATLTLARFREQRRTFGHLALALALFCAYLAWAGGDYMALYRFLVPLLPLAMVPAAALLQALFDGGARLGLPAVARAAAGLALLAGGGYALTRPSVVSVTTPQHPLSTSMSTIARMKRNSAQWELLGKALHEKFAALPAAQQPLIAVTAAGAIPFFSKLPTLDQSGLCDRHVAKVESDPWLLDRPGHMKQATRRYMGERKPALVFWHPQIKPSGMSPREFPIPPTPDYELRAMAIPGLTDVSGECVYLWTRKEAAAQMQARGVVTVAESAAWSKKPLAAPDDPGKTAKQKKKEEEVAFLMAELDLPPPPAPAAIDPPLPAPAAGPRLATQRIGAAPADADEPRFSIADVTRPLWHDLARTPLDFSGAAGSYVEFEVASVPPLGEAPDPKDPAKKVAVVLGAGGTKLPKSVVAALVTPAGRVELKTALVAPAADGVAAWRRVRCELAGVAPCSAELDVTIDGQPAHADDATKRGWFVTVPRVHQPADGDDARPNVLVITIDTLRADYLRCYGHDRPTSTAIDGLAKSGVVFERNLSQASWTLPSYSSCFSGQYVEAHGVVHRDHKFQGRFVTWIEKLAAAGWEVGGYASGTFTDSHWGFDQGFDSYDDLGMVQDESKFDATAAANGMAVEDPEAMKTAAHRRVTSPEIANKAIAFLDEHRDRRFCLFAHFFDPHEDYVKHPGVNQLFPERPVPPSFPNSVDPMPEVTARIRALYEAEIAFTDFHVGRVLKRLDALGLADKTVVVLFSDHGEAFKEHVLTTRAANADDDGKDPQAAARDKSRENVGHGSSLFNEQVHVPLIFRAPGVAPGRVRTPSGNLDIGPTLLELCEVDADDWVHHGKSLVDAMRTKEGDAERRVFSAQFQAMPRPGDAPGERVQAAHRVDQDDLAAIAYETNKQGQKGQRFLFSWKDRWQEFGKSLIQTMGAQFDALERAYQARREELRKLPPPAEVMEEGAGLLDVLEKTGYAQRQGQ